MSITMKAPTVRVWRANTAQERDQADVNKAQWVGFAHSFQDLVDFSHGGGYLFYTKGISPNHTVLTYAEVAAMFGESPWVQMARKARIWGFIRRLYYTYIWPHTVRAMTRKEFHSCETISSNLFREDSDVFIYRGGMGSMLSIAEVHMSGVKSGGSTKIYIWVRKVLYRGADSKLAAGSTFVADLKDFWIRK